PAVSRSYYDSANSQWAMAYQFASTAEATQVADWSSPIVIANTGSLGPTNQLVVVAGRPAICYDDTLNQAVRYAIADVDGQTAGDWIYDVQVNTGTNGSAPSLAVVNGKPAVAYY